jgi:hypothetical protein
LYNNDGGVYNDSDGAAYDDGRNAYGDTGAACDDSAGAHDDVTELLMTVLKLLLIKVQAFEWVLPHHPESLRVDPHISQAPHVREQGNRFLKCY